jgi:hypothetical protein
MFDYNKMDQHILNLVFILFKESPQLMIYLQLIYLISITR